MKRYEIELRPAAVRALKKLDRASSRRIRDAISLLAHDPRPPASRPVKGRDAWRVRVGDYRVIYLIEDERLVIVVVTLGHRRDVYR